MPGIHRTQNYYIQSRKKAPLTLYRKYNILEFVMFTLLYSGGDPETFDGDC